MSIYIITGIPGSGKSYFAVWHMWKNYLHHDSESESIGWKINEGFQIITNIEDFDKRVPQSRNISKILDFYNMSYQEFFSMEIQDKITKSDGCLICDKDDDENLPQKKDGEKWKIIYFIDEAQSIFGSRYTIENKDTEKDTALYFQKHRHLGHTIYLITQDIKLIWTKLWRIAESEIRAVPKHLKIPGFMYYQFRIAGTKTIEKTKSFPIKKEVFALYKSMDVDESEKVKRPFKMILFFICIFTAFVQFIFSEQKSCFTLRQSRTIMVN